MTSEHKEEIELEARYNTELESEDFNLDEMINSTIEGASSPSSLDPKPTSLTPLSFESSTFLELKTLPKHLKYAYLGEQETHPVLLHPT